MMSDKPQIRGSGGDSPHVATEANDSLQSSSLIKIVDLLCEGEIVGLVNGAQSIYLDSTPLQNANGTYNFDATPSSGFSLDSRTGTQNQTYISGFSSVENEVSIGTQFKTGTGPGGAIIRQITNPNLNRVRVLVSFPQLTHTDATNGDINGTSVSVSVWVQPYGGSYTQAASRTITGKSSSKYEVALTFSLSGSGPWNIRVQRDSADAPSTYTQNTSVFESYTEIVDAKLSYPNSALVALTLPAKQFSAVPTRYYDVKLLKILVPTNYDPPTRVYTGTWDGTFKVAWSDNPAWVFYDLLTNTRYGLGKFLASTQIDKWSLYSISQFCDQLVPDGFGGMEPRFTCNILFADRAEAYTVLQNLASVFRGMIYWSSGLVSLSQDSPKDPTYLYTPANVVDGRFTYQGSSAKTRHTVALVSWNDPANFYKSAVEYVEDQAGIAKYGVQETQVVAVGCTSRGQAHRLGKWLLYTEQHEGETITFQTGVEGSIAFPGQIVAVTDPSRAGKRMGGRISSATSTIVTLDQVLDSTYVGATLQVMLPNGGIDTKIISAVNGATVTVPTFTTTPNSQSVWMLTTAVLNPVNYRVIGLKEEDSGAFTITAITHDPSKFAFIEQNVLLEPKSYSILTAAPAAPVNLVISEALYQSSAEVRNKVTFSWDNVDRASSYLASYKIDNSNYINLPETSNNDIEVLDAPVGIYTLSVVAVNSLGGQSPASIVTKQVYGKTAPPNDVQNFSLLPSAGVAMLSWDRSIDLDVIVGGSVKVRFSPAVSGALWKNAVDIVPSISGAATSVVAPLLNGTYLIKFIDSSGNFSVNEKIIETTVPEIQALNVVQTFQEDPSFAGVKSNMELASLGSGISLQTGSLIDTYPSFDALASLDYPGRVQPYGTYDFANVVDLGGVWPARILSTINVLGFDILNFIDERLDNMDNWADIDGNVINDVNADLFMSTTSDDPNGISPNWSPWNRLSVAEYAARGFKFELRCTTGSDTHNLLVQNIGIRVDMDDRSLNLGPFTSGASLYHVTFTEPFYQAPVVGITAQNMTSGDYFQYSNLTNTGVDVTFYNSSNTIVSRQFSIIAKGFGRKVA